MKTRRQFIRSSMMGMAASWTLPSFLNSTILSMDLAAATAPSTGKDQPILIVLQMGGGNDGLNTIIPHADDAYHRARSSLAIAPGDVLRIDDHLGMHPQLSGLKNLYDSGHLAVINGVGYPNPNRSHFRSMEIWHTASDADKNASHGWIGRYFDSNCTGQPPTVGVNIGNTTPQAFVAESPLGVSFSDPRQFQAAGAEDEPMMAADDDSDDPTGGNAGGSIDMLGGAAQTSGDPLSFLRRTTLDAELSSRDIQDLVRRTPAGSGYPNGRLARDLRLVAQLIAGGLPTRVYYVHQGGYDTHANQRGTHDRLMGELSTSLAAFCKDLQQQGNFNRVAIMTFSEFGRRVAENGSRGTDHGAAGPMFLLGGAVRPGLHGVQPDLGDLDRGDLKHHTDFRAVYAAVLDQWLRVPPQPILGRDFPRPALFQT